LIFTPSESRKYEKQRGLLRGHGPSFEDRDLLTTIFLENAEATEARNRYGVKPGSFVVVLVGRDGGEKFRSEDPVSAQELFDRIDAMPMRRREMRES
jgi:hypothetical protein